MDPSNRVSGQVGRASLKEVEEELPKISNHLNKKWSVGIGKKLELVVARICGFFHSIFDLLRGLSLARHKSTSSPKQINASWKKEDKAKPPTNLPREEFIRAARDFLKTEFHQLVLDSKERDPSFFEDAIRDIVTNENFKNGKDVTFLDLNNSEKTLYVSDYFFGDIFRQPLLALSNKAICSYLPHLKENLPSVPKEDESSLDRINASRFFRSLMNEINLADGINQVDHAEVKYSTE